MNSAVLENGLRKAYIDSDIECDNYYKPQFVSNNVKENKKVLSVLKEELLHCENFCISVAFITESGVVPLLNILKELENKDIKGKILTTDYLGFNEPKALTRLAEFKNIELKMFMTSDNMEGFHTKGYIFKNKDIYNIILGSSNLTQKALSVNKEWNTKIVSTENGEVVKDILTEFDDLWNSDRSLKYNDFIDSYIEKFRIIENQRKIANANKVTDIQSFKLQPNDMQLDFINNLRGLLERGEKRALLISATGTGKTYASAFALRELGFKKILFLVHRSQIANQAKESYKRIFGNTLSCKVLDDIEKDKNEGCLFTTIQMLKTNDKYKKFDKNFFDAIVIDEVHRVGDNTYQDIVNYFNPRILLGMTASPERLDGFNIFEVFDHNIATEIRLQQALENDYLCPFHYFGITGFKSDDCELDDSDKIQLRRFKDLQIDKMVDYVIKQIEFYGYSGDRVNGLVFCSSIEDANKLSERFNQHYKTDGTKYRTVVLTGQDSPKKREMFIDKLITDDLEEKIDYIFTVDIFNEGVDIPEINQIVMLRPTESPIIFVQQLGRGLRKVKNGNIKKDFLTVLDFIGNYSNNYMIPIALYGDRTYVKDNVRRYLTEGDKMIPGASTISFDEIAKKKIFKSIDFANFNTAKIIKDSYDNLKYKLGRVPSLFDFDAYGELDPLKFVSKYGSYTNYLLKYEDEYSAYKYSLNNNNTEVFLDTDLKTIEYISKKFINGKRIYELVLLKLLLTQKNNLISKFKEIMKEEYDINLNEFDIISTINNLNGEFLVSSDKKLYGKCIFIEKDNTGEYVRSKFIENKFEFNEFKRVYNELVEFGLYRNKLKYFDKYKDSQFVLYEKYNYEDVCRLLNWKTNIPGINMGGYIFEKETNCLPVFINYDKSDEISDTLKYEDKFENNSKFYSISKSGRTIESKDVQNLVYSNKKGIKVDLFVRKNKDDNETKEFYYLGRINPTGKYEEFVMNNTNKTAVKIEWVLETPVRNDIYDYLIK